MPAFFAACLLGSAGAHAQHYVFPTSGLDSGLMNLNVGVFLEDHTGVVWLGTENGVFTADGTHFKKKSAFTAAGLQFIRALHEDRAGRVWAIDNRHLVYLHHDAAHAVDLDPATRASGATASRRIKIEDVDMATLPAPADGVYLLRDGALWEVVSSDQGRSWTVVPALKPQLLSDHPELRALTSIATAGGSTLWAGCGTSLCRIDPREGSVEVFDETSGVTPDTWKRLLISHAGAVWARGRHHVISLARDAARFTDVEGSTLGAELDVQSPALAEDPSGNVLLNLAQGVARIEGSTVQVVGRDNGLVDDAIGTLLIDGSGTVWLASMGHGVAHWPGYGDWQGWTRADGLSSNIVWSAAPDGAGHVWVATETNLDRLDLRTQRAVARPGANGFRRLRALVVDARRHVWTGDSDGNVLELDPATGAARVAATQLGRIYKLLIDRRQRLWVCSSQGLRFFVPDDAWAAARSVAASDLPPGYASSITESPDGTLWVTTQRGITRLAGDRWTPIEIPFDGGSGYDFLIAAAPDGSLWAQTKQPFSLLKLRVEGNVATAVATFGADVLGSDNLIFMAVDARNWLWIGSDDGFQVFDGARWIHGTTADGLLWDDLDSNGFFADADGSVWIGTSGGLSHLEHPERLFAVPAPSVRLARADIGDTDLLKNTNPQIDRRTPSLAVQLLDTNYGRGGGIVYRYKLDGQENQ